MAYSDWKRDFQAAGSGDPERTAQLWNLENETRINRQRGQFKRLLDCEHKRTVASGEAPGRAAIIAMDRAVQDTKAVDSRWLGLLPVPAGASVPAAVETYVTATQVARYRTNGPFDPDDPSKQVEVLDPLKTVVEAGRRVPYRRFVWVTFEVDRRLPAREDPTRVKRELGLDHFPEGDYAIRFPLTIRPDDRIYCAMDFDGLRHLDQAELNDYVWCRLRCEPPVDPPIAARFGQEPPEQFLIQAVRQDEDRAFRRRLIEAARDNLRRLADRDAASAGTLWAEPGTDQQIASLAFLAAGIEAAELIDAFYRFSLSWLMTTSGNVPEVSDGQFHVLRTLSRLQTGSKLAGLWEDLWNKGPRAIRGLTMFGWARADADRALEHLGELADMGDEIDLPAAIWSLIRRRGPGIFKLAGAAAKLSQDQRAEIRQAMTRAGADVVTLRDFDLKAGLPQSPPGDFPFPGGTEPVNQQAARQPLAFAA